MKITNISEAPELSNSGDRQCGHRTSMTTHQAGSPVSGTTSECQLSKAVARLAYQLRKGRRVERSVKQVFHILVGSASRPKPGYAYSAPPGQFKSVPPPTVAPPPPRTIRSLPRDGVLKEPLRKRPLGFVAQLDKTPLPPAERSRIPEERLPGGVLRVRRVPNVGYDPRVFGTFLEAPVMAQYRQALFDYQEGRRSATFTPLEKVIFGSDPIISNITPGVTSIFEDWFEGSCGFVPLGWPLNCPRAKVSSFELSAALTSLEKLAAEPPAVTKEQVQLVLQDAFSELDARVTRLQNYVPVKRDPALEAAGWYGPDSLQW